MKWPFDERPLCCTRDVVQPFSVAPALSAHSGRKLQGDECGGYRWKSSVEKWTTGEADSPWSLLHDSEKRPVAAPTSLHPAFQQNHWKSIARSVSPARAFILTWHCTPSVP